MVSRHKDYIFPAYLDRFNASISLVDDQMTWIENLLGPYPFEVYGHAAIDQSGAALETQTMSRHAGLGFREDVLMHEMHTCG